MVVFTKIQRISLTEYVRLFEADVKMQISKRRSYWYHLIKHNNLKCPISKEIVCYCRLDNHIINNTKHYNFYSGNDIFFTIDHIIPKSKGGIDSIENIQPMIAVENFKKSNNI